METVRAVRVVAMAVLLGVVLVVGASAVGFVLVGYWQVFAVWIGGAGGDGAVGVLGGVRFGAAVALGVAFPIGADWSWHRWRGTPFKIREWLDD